MNQPSDQHTFDQFKRWLDTQAPEGDANPDRGAEIHAEKNSPWVNGAYSHLKFPPYQRREYPKMLYHPSYGEARKQQAAALRVPARGTEDGAREQALLEAHRALSAATHIVQDAEEEAACAGTWFESPALAEAAREAWAQQVAQAAAESAFADRRMSPQAQAERQAYDAESETHVVDVPAPRSRPRPGRAAHRDQAEQTDAT
jgi:hypothetical protein